MVLKKTMISKRLLQAGLLSLVTGLLLPYVVHPSAGVELNLVHGLRGLLLGASLVVLIAARRRMGVALLGLGVLTCPAMASPAPAGIETHSGFFTTSDHVKLHYLEAGKGPAIVFVPGWTMPGWIWEPQIRHFAEHFHVVALDPRSQGDSEKALTGNDAPRRARDVKELVDALHLSPAVLVGWSLAVPELLTYAEQFGGESVRGYVLVDGFAWTKQDPQFVTAMMGLYGQVQTNRQRFTEAFVRNMYRKPQPDEYIQRLVNISLEMPADSAVAASVSSVGRADYGPAIKKIDRPVMVVCETQLKAMAADPVQGLVPSARVELFEKAGHALFVDEADHFNQVLNDFIAHLPVSDGKTASRN